MKIKNDEGIEIEVFTADDVAARESAAVATATAEFGKTKKQIEDERDAAKTALAARTNEFSQFRKLRDEDVAKLSATEKALYENQLALAKEKEDGAKKDKERLDAMVDTAIRAKAGKDEKLSAKMREMWGVVAIEATTPEQIEQKTMMILGALGTTQPDLVASVAGFSGGSFAPVPAKNGGEKSFADTDQGKRGAAELGLTLEAKK